MNDGHLGKCKDCTKKDVQKHYVETRLERHAYERTRFQRPERKKKASTYQLRYRKLNPEKYRARNAVSNALRDGRLVRQSCLVCGERAQAHHEDYSRPLEVVWLCFKHHREDKHHQIVTSKHDQKGDRHGSEEEQRGSEE
jgi:hypothetical protein